MNAGVPRSEWLLPDDGIVDEIAVEIAAAGERRVRLTWPERYAAARLIVARGGTAYDVASRLFINGTTARALAAAAAAAAAGQVAA